MLQFKHRIFHLASFLTSRSIETLFLPSTWKIPLRLLHFPSYLLHLLILWVSALAPPTWGQLLWQNLLVPLLPLCRLQNRDLVQTGVGPISDTHLLSLSETMNGYVTQSLSTSYKIEVGQVGSPGHKGSDPVHRCPFPVPSPFTCNADLMSSFEIFWGRKNHSGGEGSDFLAWLHQMWTAYLQFPVK